MADIMWRGTAAKKRQQDEIVIALTWAQGDTITLTIGGVDFTITIGTLVTTPQVATTLKQAFNGETLTDTDASYSTYGGARAIPEFREFDAATVASSTVTFNVTTSGKPVTLECSSTTAGDGTTTLNHNVVATGPNFGDNNDNYSGTPAHGDRLIFPAGCNVDFLYNIELSWQPSAFIRMKGFRGKVGLDETNTDNAQYPYREYRPRYLKPGDNNAAGTCSIDLGEGQGATRFNVDFADLEYAITAYGSSQRTNTGVPPILLKGTNAANSLVNMGGDVAYCFYPDEAGHLASVYNTGTGKTVIGSGVDLDDATVRCAAGSLETNSQTSTSSSVACTGGTLTLNAGNQLTITVSSGGRVNLRNGGATITTLKIFGGTVAKETPASITFTNAIQLYDQATFLAEDGNIPTSTQFVVNGCEWQDVTVRVGEGRTWTLAV